MFHQERHTDYLFPVTFNDILPLDLTEAFPLPDVEYIGVGDAVMYEYVNAWGAVERRFTGVVAAVCYNTNRALVASPTEYQSYWCSVEHLSLVSVAATAAAIAAVVAA